jgi:hypothetical protein
VRGVKRAEERPLGASFLEAIPFPGRAASSGETVEGVRRDGAHLGRLGAMNKRRCGYYRIHEEENEREVTQEHKKIK